MKHNTEIGIRRIGFIQCFLAYHIIHNSYPETPEELATVTCSLLQEKAFQKHRKWFLEYIQGLDND